MSLAARKLAPASPEQPLGRPARVLYVVNGLGVGGAEHQLCLLATGLDRRRFVPAVAVLEDGGSRRAVLDEAGIPVLTFVRAGRFAVGFFPALVRAARAFDIVHAWLSPAVFFGLAAGRLGGVRVLVGSERGSAYANPGFWHALLVRAEGALLERAAGVIANSDAGAALSRARGIAPDRIHVVTNALPPGGADASRARAITRGRLRAGPQETVVLVAASLTLKKDHANLLDALGRLAARGVTPTVWLAGDGPLREPLVARARDLGLEGHVRFLGQRSDVPELLAASDLAVLPSKEREGCSNFVLEALAAGVAVIATDIGGIREILTDGQSGLIVPPRSPDLLADAMVELIADDEMRRLLAQRGRIVAAERFGLDRMIEATQALYDGWLRAAAR